MDDKLVRAVLASAGNQIAGRIRIQKIFYLLDQLGMNSGCNFTYHHYGPFADDLAQCLAIESAFSEDIFEISKMSSYGTKFSIYELRSDLEFDSVGELEFSDAQRFVGLLTQPTSVVIELAATIHWLKFKEEVKDWRSELKERKPEKASEVNVEKAVELLNKLGLF